MKKVLCLALVLVFLLAVSISVSADGAEVDWSSIDWETFDWTQFETLDKQSPFYQWIKEDANFHDIFTFWSHYVAAQMEYKSEGITHSIYLRFAENPEGFLIALSEENAEVQNMTVEKLGSYIGVMMDPKETIPILEGIRLSEAENPTAVALMKDLIIKAENKMNQWGGEYDIEIPKTGDPLLLIVALALFSGSGLGVLLKKKKEWL